MYLTLLHQETPAWETLSEAKWGPEWSTAGGWWLPAGSRSNQVSIDSMWERGDMSYWEDAYECFGA